MDKRKQQMEMQYGPLSGGGSSSTPRTSGLDHTAFESGKMESIQEVAARLNKDNHDLSYVKDGDIIDYVGGPITAGGAMLVGYQRTEKQNSEG